MIDFFTLSLKSLVSLTFQAGHQDFLGIIFMRSDHFKHYNFVNDNTCCYMLFKYCQS